MKSPTDHPGTPIGNGRICINDCTLREGAQAPGVVFSNEQSMQVAALLVAAGVDMIECGHAAVSAAERARIKATTVVAGCIPVLAHARARREDIDAVLKTGAEWTGVFLGCNEISRRSRIVGATLDELMTMIDKTVAYARRVGLRVRFTVEDASRTDRATLERAFMTAIEAGADRIAFADTVGILEPSEVQRAAHDLASKFPSMPLEFHLHDDRGLAVANALAAIDGGADWISCSVNGLGERSGITDTFLLLANLHHRGERQLRDAHALRSVSGLVSAFSRIEVDPLRPVIGRHAFTHTALLHQRAVRVDAMTYSWIDPAVLAGQITFSSAGAMSLDELLVDAGPFRPGQATEDADDRPDSRSEPEHKR